MIFTRKRIIYGILAIVVIALIGGVMLAKAGNKGVTTVTVKPGDIERTVLATGSVTSSTDLDLSFKSTGLIEEVNVKVGQKVERGDVLAALTQGSEAASLTQARGALAKANADYKKLIAGADTPEVNLAKAAVASAQTAYNNALDSYDATVAQQEVLVKNAQKTYFNSGLVVERDDTDDEYPDIALSGSYNGTESGEYRFHIEVGTPRKLVYFGIEKGSSSITPGMPTKLGSKGLYITLPEDGGVPYNIDYKVVIPNPQSTDYTARNNYDAAVQAKVQAELTAQNTLNSAKANLDEANISLEKTLSAARPEDVEIYKAAILSAEGQVQAAMANYESTVIRAPASGTITKINAKPGEQSDHTEPAIVLKDIDGLYVEANVSEANIALLKEDQEVDLTFDALGSSRVFKGRVVLIDPASTLVSGIVNYKVTASVEKLDEIKPGMTANLKIYNFKKANVLAVPKRALVGKDGRWYVRVVTNSKSKDFSEEEVKLGQEADGGLVEITSGLNKDVEIVSDIKE